MAGGTAPNVATFNLGLCQCFISSPNRYL